MRERHRICSLTSRTARCRRCLTSSPDGALDGHPASSKFDLFRGVHQEHHPSLPKATRSNGKARRSSSRWTRAVDTMISGFIQPVDFFGNGTAHSDDCGFTVSRGGGHISHVYNEHSSFVKFVERNWHLGKLTERSRDKTCPNPRVDDDNPYVPVNMPAIGDLFDLFNFGDDHDFGGDQDRGGDPGFPIVDPSQNWTASTKWGAGSQAGLCFFCRAIVATERHGATSAVKSAGRTLSSHGKSAVCRLCHDQRSGAARVNTMLEVMGRTGRTSRRPRFNGCLLPMQSVWSNLRSNWASPRRLPPVWKQPSDKRRRIAPMNGNTIYEQPRLKPRGGRDHRHQHLRSQLRGAVAWSMRMSRMAGNRQDLHRSAQVASRPAAAAGHAARRRRAARARLPPRSFARAAETDGNRAVSGSF